MLTLLHYNYIADSDMCSSQCHACQLNAPNITYIRSLIYDKTVLTYINKTNHKIIEYKVQV